MYQDNQNYNQPAVPPLYPMDPCRPMPQQPIAQPYMPQPMEPLQMPMCPMMNPRFRECVQMCMMQCGNYPTPYEYPMDTDYIVSNPYYPEKNE